MFCKSLAASYLAIALLFLANFVANFAWCAPAIAQQSPASAASSSNDLLLATPSQMAQVYQSNEPIAAYLIGSSNSGGLSGPSSKRARKMSAFVPMRGRRRDQSTTGGVSLLKDSDDASIWRLINAMASNINSNNNNQQQQLTQWNMDQLQQQQQQQPQLQPQQQQQLIIPRQFADQFAMQHNLRHQQQHLPASGEASEMLMLINGNDLVSSNSGSGGDGGELMQAKLRRAFHPMRGKRLMMKFNDLDNQLVGADSDNMPQAVLSEV